MDKDFELLRYQFAFRCLSMPFMEKIEGKFNFQWVSSEQWPWRKRVSLEHLFQYLTEESFFESALVCANFHCLICLLSIIDKIEITKESEKPPKLLLNLFLNVLHYWHIQKCSFMFVYRFSCECLLYVDAAIADKCHQCNIDNHFVGKIGAMQVARTVTDHGRNGESSIQIICSIAYDAAHFSHCYMWTTTHGMIEQRFGEKETMELLVFSNCSFSNYWKCIFFRWILFRAFNCVDSSYFIILVSFILFSSLSSVARIFNNISPDWKSSSCLLEVCQANLFSY